MHERCWHQESAAEVIRILNSDAAKGLDQAAVAKLQACTI